MVENTRSNTIIVGDLDVKQMAQPKVKDGIKQKKTERKERSKSFYSGFRKFR